MLPTLLSHYQDGSRHDYRQAAAVLVAYDGQDQPILSDDAEPSLCLPADLRQRLHVRTKVKEFPQSEFFLVCRSNAWMALPEVPHRHMDLVAEIYRRQTISFRISCASIASRRPRSNRFKPPLSPIRVSGELSDPADPGARPEGRAAGRKIPIVVRLVFLVAFLFTTLGLVESAFMVYDLFTGSLSAQRAPDLGFGIRSWTVHHALRPGYSSPDIHTNFLRSALA